MNWLEKVSSRSLLRNIAFVTFTVHPSSILNGWEFCWTFLLCRVKSSLRNHHRRPFMCFFEENKVDSFNLTQADFLYYLATLMVCLGNWYWMTVKIKIWAESLNWNISFAGSLDGMEWTLRFVVSHSCVIVLIRVNCIIYWITRGIVLRICFIEMRVSHYTVYLLRD